MKVQVVEAIEREDFSSIAAPIYSKGFIKLYAEYVGLDPKPLIDDFVNRFLSPHIETQTAEEPGIESAQVKSVVDEPASVIQGQEESKKAKETEIRQVTEVISDKEEMDLFTHASINKQSDVTFHHESVKEVTEKKMSQEQDVLDKEGKHTEVNLDERNKKIYLSLIKEKAMNVFGIVSSWLYSLSNFLKRRSKREANIGDDFERFQQARKVNTSLSFSTWLSIIGGIILILVFVFSIISRFMHSRESVHTDVNKISLETINPIISPPPPYID